MTTRALSHQQDIFRHAAVEASAALSTWLGRPTTISINEVAALPLHDAVGMLGAGDTPLVACAMHITGPFTGLLVLTCDDASGLALAEMILAGAGQTDGGWGELQQSALVETANIIGCAYLNTVARPTVAGDAAAIMPSPPWFVRDYAATVMESIVMTQAASSDTVFLTHSDFSIEGSPVTCSLIFVPEADHAG
jgi:chemotaxis protein CheC